MADDDQRPEEMPSTSFVSDEQSKQHYEDPSAFGRSESGPAFKVT